MKVFPWPTVGGYDYYEVVSALQKSIRRGLEEDALFWGTELYLSEYVGHAWNRLLIISSEDVGLAAPEVSVQVKTLRDLYKEDKKSGEARLYFIHAILALVRAPKSRLVDHALIVFFEGPREKRGIPDYALDIHTTQGRVMGRGNEHFFERGAVLKNGTDDPYRQRAKAIRCQKK
jgi:replication-associated recombination protein RarA